MSLKVVIESAPVNATVDARTVDGFSHHPYASDV